MSLTPNKQDELTDHELSELSRMLNRNDLGGILRALMQLSEKWAELYEITEDEPEQRSWQRDAARLAKWYKDVEN